MANVKIKGTQIIQPAEPTFNGVIPLTELDMVGSFTHTPWVYFYKHTCNFKLIITRLRDSLSQTLVHFYPFTGRLIYTTTSPDGNSSSVVLHCGGSDSGGAVFIEAEYNRELEDFGGSGGFFSDLNKLGNLIPSLEQYDQKQKHKVPLLLVQLTSFRCGGFSIGILASHLADGLSLGHFLKEWARNARGESLETPPFMDSTILISRQQSADEEGQLSGLDTIKIQEDSKHLENNNQDKPPINDIAANDNKSTTMALLNLTKTQIDKLKNIAANNCNADGGRPYSRYELITAHMWRCLCKAKGYNEMSEAQTTLGIVADVRGRVHPSLPPHYFGNGAMIVEVKAQAGDIISKPLAFICEELIRPTINRITFEHIQSKIEQLRRRRLKTSCSINDDDESNMDLFVTKWLRMPLFGVDFGWGNEICMRSGPVYWEGASAIMPHKEEDGDEDGQVNVVICLQEVHMERFKKYFYDDIVIYHDRV